MNITFDFDTELRSYGVDPAVKCLARKRTSLAEVTIILPMSGNLFKGQRSELTYGFNKPRVFEHLCHLVWSMVLFMVLLFLMPQRYALFITTIQHCTKYYISHNLAY